MSQYLFPDKYLNYKDMMSDINLLCNHFPKKCEVEKIEIAKTIEGRAIIAIRVFPKGKQVEQPTLWMDANMHSIELIGTNTVLAHIEHLKTKLIENEKKYFDVNYVFVPRICPDGAELYFINSKVNRSNARDSRSQKELGSVWQRECLLEKDERKIEIDLFKNKKRLGFMRKKSEAGIWTCDEMYPELMRRRELGDDGPFFDIYPEGNILNFDGINIPSSFSVSENEIDLNRNFPTDWAANIIENKSGKMPLSEIESRAIADFAMKIPNIYFWLNYHTFGGVFIRPPGHFSDGEMNIFDRSVYHSIDAKLEELTKYPAVSGFQEFTYIPGKPLRGALSEYAYHALGAFSYVCELWDLPARLGRQERPFIKRYENWSKKEWRQFYEFDRSENNSLIFGHPWKAYQHAQLGEIEISEFPVQFGINNPPQKLISEVIQNQVKLLPLLVDLAPKPKIEVKIENTEDKNLKYALLSIQNNGFLPTFISEERNKAQGSKKILVEVIEVKNGKLIGENIYHLNELYGYARINNGWLDSANSGTSKQTLQILRIPFIVDKQNLGAVFKVSFACIGEYFITLGEV
ncbi:M14 family metallopeptidase [Fluviispira vulneris]|uniref:M14 family metallopeptidase n=1 Tax=Fluviispira vulneris TaxID=2763012 RepID=UPI001647CA94|nr:M14 family metallopeptidase [Fluviispira vulneris]